LVATLRGNLPQIKPFVVGPFDFAQDRPFDQVKANGW
jgi:hypothetical protein